MTEIMFRGPGLTLSLVVQTSGEIQLIVEIPQLVGPNNSNTVMGTEHVLLSPFMYLHT